MRDVVYIEFYDVLNEEDFDPKVRQPMSNIRMLSKKTFEVKDIPFDNECFVEKYSVLMPVECSKKVAEFNFTVQFKKTVPSEMVARPLCGAPEGVPVTMGYLLTAKAIFAKQFALNHSKELDKANIQCRLRNLTQLAKKGQSTSTSSALSSH